MVIVTEKPGIYFFFDVVSVYENFWVETRFVSFLNLMEFVIWVKYWIFYEFSLVLNYFRLFTCSNYYFWCSFWIILYWKLWSELYFWLFFFIYFNGYLCLKTSSSWSSEKNRIYYFLYVCFVYKYKIRTPFINI